jgi:PKD repeat protein
MWTFGDGATAQVENPSHTYSVTAPADFTVTLTVTDDEGATGVESRTVSVSPPPPPPPIAEGCTTLGTRVDCALDVTARVTIKLRLLAVSCDLHKQRITVPQGDQVFLNVCSRTAGDSTRIFGGPLDEAVVFEPGSQVRLRFNQGTADDGEPVLAAPAARVTGTFPNCTINFEDGDDAGGEGEPDFTDVVFGVEAVAAR